MKPQHPPGREGPPMPHTSNYSNLPPPRYPANGFKTGYPPHGIRHPDLFTRNMFPGMFPDRFSIPSLLAMNMHHHVGGRAPARHGYLHPFPQAPRPYTPHGNKSPTRNSGSGSSSSSYGRNRSPDRSHSGHGMHRYSEKKGSYEEKSGRKQSPVPPRDSSPAAPVGAVSRGRSPTSRPASRGPSPHKHTGAGGKSPSQLSASGRSPKAAGSKSPLSIIRNTAVSCATGERSPLRITISTDGGAKDKSRSETPSLTATSMASASGSLSGSGVASSSAVLAKSNSAGDSSGVVCVKPTSTMTTSTKTLTTVIKLPTSGIKSSGSTPQSLPLKKRICTAYALEQDTSIDLQGKKIHVITDLTTTSVQASGSIDPIMRFSIPAPPPRLAVEMGDSPKDSSGKSDKRSGKSLAESQASRKRKTETLKRDPVPVEKKPKQSSPGKNQRGKSPSSPPQPTRKSARKTRATWRVADKQDKDGETTNDMTDDVVENVPSASKPENDQGTSLLSKPEDDQGTSLLSKQNGTPKSAKKESNQSKLNESKVELPSPKTTSSKQKSDKVTESFGDKSSNDKQSSKVVKASPRQPKSKSKSSDQSVESKTEKISNSQPEVASAETGHGSQKDIESSDSKEVSKSTKAASRSRSVSRNKHDKSARSKSASASRKDTEKPADWSGDKHADIQKDSEEKQCDGQDPKDIDQSGLPASAAHDVPKARKPDSVKAKDTSKTGGEKPKSVDSEKRKRSSPNNKKQSSSKNETASNKKISTKPAVNKEGGSNKDTSKVLDSEAKTDSETVKKTAKSDKKQASSSKKPKSSKRVEKDGGKQKSTKDQLQVSLPHTHGLTTPSKSNVATYVVKETSVQVNRLTCSNIPESLLSQLSSSLVPLRNVAHGKSLPIEASVPKDSPSAPESTGTVTRRSPRTRSKQLELLKKATPTITSLLMNKPLASPLYNVHMQIPLPQFPIRIPHLDPSQVYHAARSPNGTMLPAITEPLTCETGEKSEIPAIENVPPQSKSSGQQKKSPGKLSGPKSARRKQRRKQGGKTIDEAVIDDTGKSDSSSPMKDLKVHICKLSPKALNGKRTTSARQLEKTSCPNSQTLLSPNAEEKSPSPSKTSPRRREKGALPTDSFNVLSGPQRGSGFLEDLLWQVQKGYFLRHGREEGAVSIEEVAAVSQAVVSTDTGSDMESPMSKRGRRSSDSAVFKASPGALTSPSPLSPDSASSLAKAGAKSQDPLLPYTVTVEAVSDDEFAGLAAPPSQKKALANNDKNKGHDSSAAKTKTVSNSVPAETPKSSRSTKRTKETCKQPKKHPTRCVQKSDKVEDLAAAEDRYDSVTSVSEVTSRESGADNKCLTTEEPSASVDKDAHTDKGGRLPGLVIRLPKIQPKPREKRKYNRKSLPVDSVSELTVTTDKSAPLNSNDAETVDEKLDGAVESSGTKQLTQDKLSELLVISDPPKPVQKTRARNHKRAKTVNIPLSSDISDHSLHSELGEKVPDKASAPSDSGYSDECSITTKSSIVSGMGAPQGSESAMSLTSLSSLAPETVTPVEDAPQPTTGRGRAAKRKALTKISKGAASESKDESELTQQDPECGLLLPTKKKRGRSKATRAEEIVASVPTVPPVSVESGAAESEDCKSMSSQPPVLSQEKKKKGRPKSASCRSQPSPPPPVLQPQELNVSASNDSDDDSFAPLYIDLGTDNTKGPGGKDSCTSSVFNSPNHTSPTEISAKKFFTSQKPRCSSKMSPVAQLVGMTSPRSKSGHSPGRSIFSTAAILSRPSQKPSSDSSRDVYDFDDELDGAVPQKKSKGRAPHPSAKSPMPTTQPAKRGRKPGKRGPKPRQKVEDEEEEGEQPKPESPAPLMREPSRPQRRFLRPRRIINYSEADGERGTQETAAVPTTNNVTVNVQKSTMSLKIKIKRPSTETNEEAPASPLTEEPPLNMLKQMAAPPPQWSPGSNRPRKRQRESSASQRMTVTSETISVTTNEVMSFDPDGTPLPAPSRPPVTAPYMDSKPDPYRQASEHAGSEVCKGCMDGTCTTVTTRRVRFRLVKVGEGRWKTVSVMDDPLPQLTAPPAAQIQAPRTPDRCSRPPSPTRSVSRSGSDSDSGSESDSSTSSSRSRSKSRSSSSSRSSSRSGSSRSGSSSRSSSESESDGESHKEMPQLDDSAAYQSQDNGRSEIDPSPPVLQITPSPRRGRRKKQSLEETPDSEVDITPRRILHSRRSSATAAEEIPKLSTDSSMNTSKEESFDSPPVLEKNVYAAESFDEESSPRKTPKRGRPSTPRRPSQRFSPRLRSHSDQPAPIYEPISDYESDGDDKDKVKEFPTILSYEQYPQPEATPGRVTRSQASKGEGRLETLKNKKQGEFAVPTPPRPKYEPENVLEEAIQFDSEMSQSSCSTHSYPIVSPLTMHENKPSGKRGVQENEDMDFADSFLNGTRTLRAEIEEQIQKEQLKEQEQLPQQPPVTVTPVGFAPDFQDMDFAYDFGMLPVDAHAGAVYGTVNPADMNTVYSNRNANQTSEKAQEHSEPGFKSPAPHGSSKSSKKSSSSSKSKKAKSKRPIDEIKSSSAQQEQGDNAMDKMLNQETLGFGLLDVFDVPVFNTSVPAPPVLDDLFGSSLMDQIVSTPGDIECVDVIGETKVVVHRPGGATPRTPRSTADGHRSAAPGGHDISMAASTMGLHTCDCGAHFTDNWAYQEHEMFCSGPRLFNCGL